MGTAENEIRPLHTWSREYVAVYKIWPNLIKQISSQ